MDHLTPDVLAAWMDGTLSAVERSAAEGHAADCADCQAMLAVMARTAPPPPRAWWSAPAVRWLVPIATATVVIATVVGVTRERHSLVPQPAKSVSAVTESARSVAPVPSEPAEPQASAADRVTVPHAKSESAKVATRERKDQERRERMQSPDTPAPSGGDQLRVDALAPAATPVPPPAPPPVAPAAPPAPVSQPPAAAAPAVPPAANAAGAARPPQTPPEPVPLLPLQETVTVGGETALAKSTARAAVARIRPVDVISPERQYRWRSVTPGSIQYSMDGGVNWRSTSTVTSVLHAGSAPSRTVCWLVGQAGTVLLTIDGETWQVRPFPERVDLTGVRATDARNATVTAADRRRFATSDGGATWSPLQEN